MRGRRKGSLDTRSDCADLKGEFGGVVGGVLVLQWVKLDEVEVDDNDADEGVGVKARATRRSLTETGAV